MKRILQITSAIAITSLVACNPLGKMSKNQEQVRYNVSPNPVVLIGDSVAINASAQFPPNYFHKKAVVTITPYFEYASGGTKEISPIVLVGTDADAEGKTVAFDKGSTVNYNEDVMYTPEMANMKIMAKVVGSYKGKTKDFDPVEVGYGTIITQQLLAKDDRAILGKDKFTKVVPRTIKAQVNYDINRSNVKGSELRDADMKAMADFIKEGKEKEFVFKGVTVEAYASPDGEISVNENLANDRANSGAKAAKSMLRKNKVDAAKADEFYKKTGKGEDWDGFKEKMQASSIEDKEMILRILTMTADKQQRETEIKNLSKTYTVLADQILPELRRSMIVVNAEEKSKTDEQIAQLSTTDPAALTLEELLYAATMKDKAEDKLTVYQNVVKTYPNDWRGPNNVGYIYVMQNELDKAKAEFEKADKLSSNNAVVLNNMGVIARLNGDIAAAKNYYASASGAGPDVNYNQGIVAVREGDYALAATKFGSAKSFNASLAQLLNEDNDAAASTLDKSSDNASAMGYYLKAVIGARKKDKDMVVNNLKSAIAKDSSLKKMAKNDAEFGDYRDDAAFKSAIE